MATPNAVTKSAEKARELLQQNQQAAKTDQTDGPGPLAPPAESSTTAPESTGNTGKEDTPKEGDQNTPAPQAQGSAPAQDGKDKDTDWKAAYDQLQHKYSVLQGKYNAEVPRLADEVRQLKEHLNSAQQQGPPPQGGEEGGDSAPVDMSQIDPEQFRDFGEEFVGMAHMLKQVASDVGSVKQDVGNVKQSAEAAEQAAAEAYWTRVYQGVPDFDDVNNSAEFLEWLNGFTQTSQGMRLRNSVLQEAHAAGQAEDVVRVFQDFLQTQNQPPASSSEPGSDSQQRQAPNPNISPPASARTPVVPPDDQPTYTREQVNQFFTDLSHGKFRHNLEWAQAEKQRILAASRDGRIQ